MVGQNGERLAYFIAEPPEYEARGDYIVGTRNGIEFVFPPRVAQQVVRRLNRALTDWRTSSGEVIQFPPPGDHAASS